MNLSSNSLSARLFKWFYDTKKLPSNLCPYFWKVIWAWIMFIPYTILVSPSFIIERLSSSKSKFCQVERRGVSAILFVIVFIIISIIVAISSYWISYKDNQKLIILSTFGHLFLLVIIFGLIILLIKIIRRKIKYNQRIKSYTKVEKEPSLIKEFIKAKFNKLCPIITWKE